ncbi:MAG: TusE/DsrC/DsvC family sulfur relay protein [Thiohalobacteraceae bacterium]|nr:TusE/DsrC/DsvC family sulfur relay protein [Gammaproteobacteria bacterium]
MPEPTMFDIMHPGKRVYDPEYPHAPDRWTPDAAREVAQKEGITLTEDHWKVVRALQEYFARNENDANRINVREFHDALEEMFHAKGGLRYTYTILPGGPVAQGCRLAGLEVPTGAVDTNFGSVT